MRTCPHCGTLNRDTATYCNQCGALLVPSASPAGVASAVGQAANNPAAPAGGDTGGTPPGVTLVTAASSDPRVTNPNIPTVVGTHTTPHVSPRTGMLSPQTILNNRYLIVEKLGQGGMAAVYKVKDEAKKGEPLRAIKEMSQGALKESEREQAIANFHAEAELLRSLDHRNLPKFYEEFQDEDRHYLVMEFIDGETLEDRLERVGKGLPEADVLNWARQLCSVLTYLHERRPPIIFRDLKPGNIMVTKDGQIKLIDFGIARIFRQDKTHDTQVLGTPGYAPPEQYGKGQTDPRSDVYALGVTLHQLLTNYDPSSTPFSLPPLHTLAPDVSPHVQAAIEKATRLKRDERFESISEMYAALFAPGAFVFRGGQRAASVLELIALSRQLPQEAETYLYARYYERWLGEIGERKLVKVARAARENYKDRAQGLDAFLREASQAIGLTSASAAASASATATRPSTLIGASLQLQPGALDIGPLAPGQSGTASFTISGKSGASVSGEIKPQVSWLHVEPSHFDGPSTLIEVRADTVTLPGSQRHQGGLQVISNGQHLVMPVSVEVLGNPGTGILTRQQMRTRNHLLKYSAPPQRQLELAQQGISAIMGFGLSLTALLVVQRAIGFQSLTALLNSAWFPLLLLGWTLLTAGGAMIGRWGAGFERRALTSATCALAMLGLVALIWFNWIQPKPVGPSAPEALLVTSLACCALAAAFGAAPRFSTGILRILEAIARRSRPLIFIGMVILGGYTGYLLTRGFSFHLLEPIAIVAGIIIGASLANRLNRYIRRFRPPQANNP